MYEKGAVYLRRDYLLLPKYKEAYGTLIIDINLCQNKVTISGHAGDYSGEQFEYVDTDFWFVRDLFFEFYKGFQSKHPAIVQIRNKSSTGLLKIELKPGTLDFRLIYEAYQYLVKQYINERLLKNTETKNIVLLWL